MRNEKKYHAPAGLKKLLHLTPDEKHRRYHDILYLDDIICYYLIYSIVLDMAHLYMANFKLMVPTNSIYSSIYLVPDALILPGWSWQKSLHPSLSQSSATLLCIW